MSTIEPELLLGLADTADALTLPAWQRGDFEVVTKPDGSPVTDIDPAVEEAVQARLNDRFADDAFLGEEVGAPPGRSERTWIVDGIDGTHSFVRGRTGWATLIGLTVDGRPSAGIATSPALGRRWYTTGDGAFTVAEDGSSQRLTVSTRVGIDGARIACWPAVDTVAERRPRFAEAAGRVMSVITASSTPSEGHDVPHGAMLVIDGRLDAFVVFGGEPWDHAALAAIVSAAGGRFTALDGSGSLHGGAGIYSNGSFHDRLVEIVSGR